MNVAGFVLAAGLGTRISALSRATPKPLLPVGLSTPFDRAVDALRRGGATRVVANASHLAPMVVARGRARDVEVRVEENGPFGTAGGLANAAIDADVVAIWNGDIVATIDVGDLIAALPGSDAVLAVRGKLPPGAGNVGLDAYGRVVRLRDRSFGDEASGAWFAAVQVLRRGLVARAPSRGCLVGDLLIPSLAAGVRVCAVTTHGPWHDVGDLPSYLAANLDEAPIVAGHVDPGVVVKRAIVGEGATVTGAGVLDRVVVFPRARATAPLDSAIVTEAEVIPVERVDAVA